jgi:hypothetical protein
MRTAGAVGVALVGLLTLAALTRAQSPTQRKKVTYPVEATVWEIDDEGKKTLRANELLRIAEGESLDFNLRGDSRAAGQVDSKPRFFKHLFQVSCGVATWDKDRLALTVWVETLGDLRPGLGLGAERQRLREFRFSKVMRPGQALKVEINRGELLRGYQDIGGNFVLRFRVRHPQVGEE